MADISPAPHGGTTIAVHASVDEPGFRTILSPAALRFLGRLHGRFDAARRHLLHLRATRLQNIRPEALDFSPATASVRKSEWQVAAPPKDLEDRCVEITGPVDRKMVINALNSGARVYMADFEDSTSPTWHNLLSGQVNLHDAVCRTISLQVGEKEYSLKPSVATLMVRPRGLHLVDEHLRVNEQPISGALMDFGLYFFHNAARLIEDGSGPYFYLPKMESHLEARWWNQVFVFAQQELGIPRGTIRATCLIETLPAAFEMDEILYELREHSVGLNCGRWDYIFSAVKVLGRARDRVFPDRQEVTMTAPCMDAYVRLLIETCHRRGAHAMGGMAAQIPIKDDPVANDAALARVRADKLREVRAGHDGTWVAHPALIPLAQEAFKSVMHTPNQITRVLPPCNVTREDLLEPPRGKITLAGVRSNISVGIGYMEAWLRGVGCVPLNHLMEDAATAEICRAQLWQQLHHRVTTACGARVTPELVARLILEDETQTVRKLGTEAYRARKFDLAYELLRHMLLQHQLDPFLTLVCYPHIVTVSLQPTLSVDDASTPGEEEERPPHHSPHPDQHLHPHERDHAVGAVDDVVLLLTSRRSSDVRPVPAHL